MQVVPERREPAKPKLLLPLRMMTTQGDAPMIQHQRRLRELPRETCACQP